MGYIYIIKNTFNDKVYIGQTTKSIEKRFKEHLSSKDNFLIHRAIRKYGSENFYVFKIEECPNEKLDEREMYWIKYYDSYNHGYNMTKGGQNKGLIEPCKNYWNNNPDKRHERAVKAGEKAKIANQKHIYCLELNRYFISAKDASKITNIDYSSICKAADGKMVLSKFHWTYVSKEEYLLNDRLEWIKKHPEDRYSCFKLQNKRSKPVFCEELNQAFSSANSTGYNLVDRVCRGDRKSSGRHPITNKKLHWKYIPIEEYYDYLIKEYLNG